MKNSSVLEKGTAIYLFSFILYKKRIDNRSVKRSAFFKSVLNSQDFLLIPEAFAWQKPLNYSYHMDKNHTVLAI